MLWNASVIDGYTIQASDGDLGTVGDFLFEDDSWTVRWLVVETGTWLSGRRVLLPLSALGKPDPAARIFPVRLTMRQVKDSPDIDSDRPVSRQMESHVYGYYGLDPYWGGGFLPVSGAIAMPFSSAPLMPASQALSDVAADVALDNGDPHLRSFEEVTGYHLHAIDGEIGHVDDFLIDDADWRIRYLAVDTRNWWPGKKVVISPRSVSSIDWAQRRIHLDVSRQKVKDSPPLASTMTVDRAYAERHDAYYGWP
jgi:hypothetical protein